MKEYGLCPIFASFTLAFALQLRNKHGKNLSQGKKNLSQPLQFHRDAIHVISSSYDKPIVSSKASSPYSATQCFHFKFPASSRFIKVIQ